MTNEQEGLDHILRSHSANRPVLRAHLGLYRAIMFGDYQRFTTVTH